MPRASKRARRSSYWCEYEPGVAWPWFANADRNDAMAARSPIATSQDAAAARTSAENGAAVAVVGRVAASGLIELSNPDGKVIKALPAVTASDDEELAKEAKKQLTAARKELRTVLAEQTARLHEAMCLGRVWVASDWREYLLEHPLVGPLVSRLVWIAEPGEGQRAFRPSGDGVLLGVDDEAVEVPDDAPLTLAHRVTLGDAAAEQWRRHLADYEVTPLFDQLSNTMPAFDAAATELDDLQGHVSDTFSLRGTATKRGYQRARAEDGAWFEEYLKPFAGAGLTAVIEFTGSYLPEENIPAAVLALRFRAGVSTVALSEVPAILVAECYADYAALAALAPFDPDWERKTGL